MKELVVATRSKHKLEEIRQILADIPDLRVLDLNEAGVPSAPEEDDIEVYETFEENSLAKARYFVERSGRPVLADDSGLCVDALDGRPGVRSKRFSNRPDLQGEALDQANNEHLLRSLQGVPPEKRTGRYVCAIALAAPNGHEVVVDGSCEGVILEEPRGSNGFGYDPLFWLPGEEATFGELPQARKNAISHRARALAAVLKVLPDWLDSATSGEPTRS